MAKKKRITREMLIAEVIRRHPETGPVFKKYFGDNCYTCPGSKNEDITFGAMIHNVDTETVLGELNRVIKERK